MINLVIPIVNNNEFYETNFSHPKNLIPINGKHLIEVVIESFRGILIEQNNVIFIISLNESTKYETDKKIKKILPFARFVYTQGNTFGSVASILLSYGFVDLNLPLLILGGDQTLSLNFESILFKFVQLNSNYILTTRIISDKISSKTPFSYARLDQDKIYYIEEKKSISNNALTGIYFFRKANDFFIFSQKYILDNPEQETFYISQVINLMIENNLKFLNYSINNKEFKKYSINFFKEGKLIWLML